MRMTHDILSVKLYELDKAIGQMHSRIEQGEMDCPEQVEKDICLLYTSPSPRDS